MIVHRPRAAGIEALADPACAVGVTGQEHERGVVPGLGAKVNLRHGR